MLTVTPRGALYQCTVIESVSMVARQIVLVDSLMRYTLPLGCALLSSLSQCGCTSNCLDGFIDEIHLVSGVCNVIKSISMWLHVKLS